MVKLSLFNNTYAPLSIDGFFLGAIESTQQEVSISVNVLADVPVRVIIRQYRSSDVTSLVQENFKDVAADVKEVVQTPVKAAFFNISVLNESGGSAATKTEATTYLQASHYVNLDVRQLSATEKEDSVVCYGVDLATGLKHPLNVDASGSLIVVGGGGGDASLWANYPAVANVDMNGNDINNVTNISADGLATNNLQSKDGGITNILVGNTLNMNGENIIGASSVITQALTSPNETGLNISSPHVVSIQGDEGISISTPPLSGKDPYAMSYSNLGNLTFSLGEQNINNLLGVTHSQGFTLTNNGGGVITFADGTTQSTAGGGGGGGNFSTPSTQDLNMNNHQISNITKLIGTGVYNNPIILYNDIAFRGNPTVHNNASISNVSYINGNVEDHLTLTNVGQISSDVTNTILMNTERVAIGQTIYFLNDGTTQNTAYQNPFQTALNLNGNPIIQAPEIQSNSSMIITAGFTDTEEASTLSLSNNGYAVAGNYSELFLRPTGIELTAGNITDNISESATFDNTGLLVVPSIRTISLDMNQGIIKNAYEVAGTDYVALSANSLVNHTGEVDIYTNYTTGGTNDVPASEIWLKNDGINLYTFPNGYDGATANLATLGMDGVFTAPSLKTSALDMNGGSITKCIAVKSDGDLSISAGQVSTTAQVFITTCDSPPDNTPFSQVNLASTQVQIMTADDLDNRHTTTFKQNGDVELYSNLKVGVGGAITFADNTVQTTAYTGGGGGGNFSTPSVQTLDMSGNKIIGITELTAVGDYSDEILINSDIRFTGDPVYHGSTSITNVEILNGNADNGLTIYNVSTLNGLDNVLINCPNLVVSNNLFFNGDASTQNTAYLNLDLQNITSNDGSITVTSPSAHTVNLAVTSPYSLPVATTSVLGGVKPDGTTITATTGGVISATPQGIFSNTYYVNDNVNTINDVLPLMGIGDIAIVSAGSFGNATDITWDKAQTGLSGSVVPVPLTFLTTANASRFTVTATQVRIANIKFQLPVFLSGNNCTVDNSDFDSALTIGTNVTGYITITNAEFIGTQTITVANTFANVCYFINCNFAGSTFALNQSTAQQVIFNGCAGFTSYPANATYVGVNVLTSGSTKVNTDTLQSVAVGQPITLASDIDANGASFSNVYQMKAYEYYGTPGSGGILNIGGNINLIGHTIYNGLNITSDNLTLREGNGGSLTYQDLTTQSSGVQKGSGTLTGVGGSPQGSYFISDTRVTAGCICVATYADSPPTGGILSAIVTAGSGILIQSHLLADTSPIFYMYFI